MKRTGEITLSIIGAILSLFGVAMYGFFITFTQTDFFMYNVIEGVGTEEEIFAVTIMSGIGWLFLIFTVLGLIGGIIAAFLFKGNKRPKAAAIILIITSVILAVGTIMMGFLPALCYLIAGIMGLVRKPPHVDPEIAVTDPADEL